ncbi:MAG TPA: amidohydrolase family protein [Actinomycetota bacterium]|jgi:predicted TIM-barrel fold metal-dependent hydrolase|nr:amidohydrolase family protein [Actinomycetota bacterium]
MTDDEGRLGDLPLRSYVPRPALRRTVHDVPRARFPVVDVHAHLGRWLTGSWAAPDVSELVATMDAANVATIVNLDGAWGEELRANLRRYDRAHPGRFVTFAQWDRRLFAEEDFGERLAAQVHAAASGGARGLKVWKDLGLHLRDPGGGLVMPHDERLEPVWDACAARAMPVLIHTGDPAAFFEPLDETNERLEELLDHPDWWFGDRSRFPSFEELADSFEALVTRRANVTFIGAHAGGLAEDLGRLGGMLDTCPNLHVDIAARIAELGRVPRAAAALIARFPDRFLFGSDGTPPLAEDYASAFRFLETADEHVPYSPDAVPPQGRWAISCLDLPEEVLGAIYSRNARRLIPGLDRVGG